MVVRGGCKPLGSQTLQLFTMTTSQGYLSSLQLTGFHQTAGDGCADVSCSENSDGPDRAHADLLFLTNSK